LLLLFPLLLQLCHDLGEAKRGGGRGAAARGRRKKGKGGRGKAARVEIRTGARPRPLAQSNRQVGGGWLVVVLAHNSDRASFIIPLLN
jgi:hypothetical protein